MLPLEVNLIADSPREEVLDNLNTNRLLGLRMLDFKPPVSGAVSICGGAPSLRNTLTELKGEVWAINGAYDFLLESGVVPDVAFFWDPSEETLRHLSKPHKDTKFYLASHSSPKMFELLKDYDVYAFHVELGHELQSDIEAMDWCAPIFGGGRAGATRAPFIAYALGFREIHIHGVDGSFEDITHVNRDDRVDYNSTDIEVYCLGRKFLTLPWLALQAQDITRFHKVLPGAEIIIHGEGLVPHVAKANGFHYSQLKDFLC